MHAVKFFFVIAIFFVVQIFFLNGGVAPAVSQFRPLSHACLSSSSWILEPQLIILNFHELRCLVNCKRSCSLTSGTFFFMKGRSSVLRRSSEMSLNGASKGKGDAELLLVFG